MVRITNACLGFINILTLVISLPIIGSAAYLHLHPGSDCEKLLFLPLLVVGLFLFIVSLFGCIGSCCQVTFFSAIYQFVILLLTVGLFVFTVFAFVVTNKGVGKIVSGRGYKEYRLGDYSHWLQRRVNNGGNWEKIKSCLQDSHVCKSLGREANQIETEFFKKNLSPLQSGCCKPPTYCGFKYINATVWSIDPKTGPRVPDTDCKTWSNGQDALCFDCKSCKAGFLAVFRKQWRKIVAINVLVLVLLIIIYSIGCCVFKNNRYDNRYKGYRGPI